MIPNTASTRQTPITAALGQMRRSAVRKSPEAVSRSIFIGLLASGSIKSGETLPLDPLFPFDAVVQRLCYNTRLQGTDGVFPPPRPTGTMPMGQFFGDALSSRFAGLRFALCRRPTEVLRRWLAPPPRRTAPIWLQFTMPALATSRPMRPSNCSNICGSRASGKWRGWSLTSAVAAESWPRPFRPPGTTCWVSIIPKLCWPSRANARPELSSAGNRSFRRLFPAALPSQPSGKSSTISSIAATGPAAFREFFEIYIRHLSPAVCCSSTWPLRAAFRVQLPRAAFRKARVGRCSLRPKKTAAE
jgi:hypothetical protein